MPYVVGGVAYTQVEATYGEGNKESANAVTKIAKTTLYETATMVGIGGGIDFAMTDNVLLRVEYRFSDYGKKKFFTDNEKYNFKTNDFCVDVAYKF